jgi:hypothetical protein
MDVGQADQPIQAARRKPAEAEPMTRAPVRIIGRYFMVQRLAGDDERRLFEVPITAHKIVILVFSSSSPSKISL